MATLNDLIARVMRTLGDADGNRWTPEEITDYLNDGQQVLNGKAEILRAAVTLSVNATAYADSATAYYTVPSDIVKMKRVDYGGRELERIGLEEIGSGGDWTLEHGTPHAYLYGTYGPGLLRLYKDPGAGALSVRAYYLRSPIDLATSQAPEVPATHHTALVNYAIAQAYLKDFEYRDPTKSQAFAQMFEGAVQSATENRYSAPRSATIWSF